MGLTPTPVLPLPPEPKGAAPRSSDCPPKSGQICLHSLHCLHPRYQCPQIGGRIMVFCGGNSSTGGSRGSPMKRAGPPLVGAIGIEQIRDRCLPTFCRPRPTGKRGVHLGGLGQPAYPVSLRLPQPLISRPPPGAPQSAPCFWVWPRPLHRFVRPLGWACGRPAPGGAPWAESSGDVALRPFGTPPPRSIQRDRGARRRWRGRERSYAPSTWSGCFTTPLRIAACCHGRPGHHPWNLTLRLGGRPAQL